MLALMNQLSFLQPPVLNISELTRYLRTWMENDPTLQDVWVQGEVSNFSRPASGHWYFTLKDSSASLRCVMWRSNTLRQSVIPADGAALEVHGAVSIYEAGGQYQLYADLIRPLGEGALYQEFMRLKARLEAEGLFAQERKRPIPPWPGCIGLVTSPTGAALRDMLNTLSRRFPLASVVLAPCTVQGEEAPAAIVKALQALNQFVHPDVILLARGGGSLEDLWAFNDEGVARAIFASQAPVITGIGHETDFTIADFVADLRAPTPTAAAELATPNQADARLALAELQQDLGRAVEAVLGEQSLALQTLYNRLRLRSPQSRLASDRQRLDELSHRAGLALRHCQQLERFALAGLAQRLAALNPRSILERGYAILSFPNGQAVRQVAQVQPGDQLRAQIQDGSFDVQVCGLVAPGMNET